MIQAEFEFLELKRGEGVWALAPSALLCLRELWVHCNRFTPAYSCSMHSYLNCDCPSLTMLFIQLLVFGYECTNVINLCLQEELVIYEAFSSPEFVGKLIRLLSLEEIKGKDHYSFRKYLLFKV